MIQELLPPASHGVGIQLQELRQERIAAVPQTDRLQAGIQAALLFIEQAVEQKDCGFQFFWRHLNRGGVDGEGDGGRRAADSNLIL